MASSSDDDGDEAIAMANAMGFGLFVPRDEREVASEDDVRRATRKRSMRCDGLDD